MVSISADAALYAAKLLTTSDVARRLDVATGTVVFWIRTGQLRALKWGQTWVTTEPDLQDFLRERDS